MSDSHRELCEVAVFAACAFAFTWACHGLLIACGMTVATGKTLYRVGLLGPLLAALAITCKLAGRAGVTTFLRRGAQLRGASAACACALLLPPALYSLATVSVGDGSPKLMWPALGPLGLVAVQAWVVCCEEPGWRGFAWPRLRSRLGPISAALSLGVIWATWHVPMFFVQDSQQQGSFFEFAVVVVAWTLIMGALLSRANSSYLPALLFHGSANVCAYIFPLSSRADERAVALWIAAGALAALHLVQRDRMVRKVRVQH
jgi:membrane protease YdiL (CAAX protease family)